MTTPHSVTTGRKSWMERLHFSCRDITRLHSQSLDRRLSPGERFRLRLHCWICVWCRRYGKHLRFEHHALNLFPEKMSENATSIQMPPEAKARLKKELKDKFSA